MRVEQVLLYPRSMNWLGIGGLGNWCFILGSNLEFGKGSLRIIPEQVVIFGNVGLNAFQTISRVRPRSMLEKHDEFEVVVEDGGEWIMPRPVM